MTYFEHQKSLPEALAARGHYIVSVKDKDGNVWILKPDSSCLNGIRVLPLGSVIPMDAHVMAISWHHVAQLAETIDKLLVGEFKTLIPDPNDKRRGMIGVMLNLKKYEITHVSYRCASIDRHGLPVFDAPAENVVTPAETAPPQEAPSHRERILRAMNSILPNPIAEFVSQKSILDYIGTAGFGQIIVALEKEFDTPMHPKGIRELRNKSNPTMNHVLALVVASLLGMYGPAKL